MQKILVAEDEKALSKALELKLTSAGYEVKLASNGEEALDMINKEKFDLIILDIMMPKVDGFEVLTKLNEINYLAPRIVVSNLSQQDDVKKVKDLGALDYFVKSNVPLADLVEYINKLLKK